MPINRPLLDLALWEIELGPDRWDQTCCTPTDDDDEDEPREED